MSMARDRIVEPESVRLPISDGDYIDVKKQLNHGEHDDYWARVAPFQTVGEPMRMETRQVRTGKLLVYLLGWSLTHKGAPIPMSPEMPESARLATINSLDQDTFIELYLAVDAHEDRVQAERTARKNAQSGSGGSSTISPSPASSTGDLSGSENLTATTTTSSSTN
jgi:hypothetical protein